MQELKGRFPRHYKIETNSIPHPKARPRFRAMQSKSGGSFVKTYKPQSDSLAEREYLLEAARQIPFQFEPHTPLKVHIEFRLPTPKSRERTTHYGDPHVIKPDLDNLIKFILDCLNGRAWHDDAQIFSLESWKMYVDPTHVGTTVSIKESLE